VSETAPRAELARVIARRPHVVWWASLVIAFAFAAIALPILTADRWISALGGGRVVAGQPAPLTVRVPPFQGMDTPDAGRIGGGGGVVIARGDVATRDDEFRVGELAAVTPSGPIPYLAMFLLAGVFAALFSHHTRRSTLGRLARVQIVNLALVAVLAVVVKVAMLVTPTNVLIVPVAVFALVPTLVLDRVVGIATGTLAALIVALCVPFDVGVAILLLVQVSAAGLVVAERPKHKLRPILVAGGFTTLMTALTYPLMRYLMSGHFPIGELDDPLRSTWVAAALGPAIATGLAVVLAPPYQLLAGEITQAKLIELEDLSHPLLKQIAEKAPGTWQHSLMMANLAEIAANAIGANGRLVRVGAYYHDLGKSLAPKYFIENLDPGETSPHDKLPPEASCDAIFKHVTEGIVTARKAGLHERIIDFMHMHHGNGVLEYFWAKCQEQGNPKGLTIEAFRYPGVPPQSRETAILAICDAVEAASRTLKKADPAAIDSLVQRIVYGKLHLGQLDDSGLSMGDLRRINDSLRETIRHANHGRIEYPWQRQEAALAAQSASAVVAATTTTAPRLDSLDRTPRPEPIRAPAPEPAEPYDALAETDGIAATPQLRRGADPVPTRPGDSTPPKTLDNELANSATAPIPLLEKQRAALRTASDSNDDIVATGRAATQKSVRGAGALDSQQIADALEPREEGRATRDSRREADRAAMAARYSSETPAPRDDADPMASRPSDGDLPLSDEHRRANRRTNDTGNRNRAPGDFVANMVLTPMAKGGTPSINSDVDTGRHAQGIDGVDSTKEIDQFANDATRALRAAAPDLDILPPSVAGASVIADSIPPPTARKRAATLPPTPGMLRPPTIHPPFRRAPTVPPPARQVPADESAPIKTSAPDVRDGRAPATTLAGGAKDLRPPADRAREDAAATQPSMQAITPSDLATVGEFNQRSSDAAVTRPVPKQAAETLDDSAVTQPAMLRADAGDDTEPAIEILPTTSDAAIVLDKISEKASGKQTTWARGLAARIDASVDDEFGRETPTRAPSRAELQALVDTPPDATRQQSIEEIERLQRDPAARRSEEELHFKPRRAPFPTAEVSEEDIEAAIEIAPSARRTGSIPIGIAKKKPSE